MTAPAAAFPGAAQLPLPPVPPPDKVAVAMATAHRVDNSARELAHASERLTASRKAASPRIRDLFVTHVRNHLAAALISGHQLADNIRANYPAEAAELARLQQTIGLAVSAYPAAKVASFAHLVQTILYHEAHAKRHADALGTFHNQAGWDFDADHAARHIDGAAEHVQKLAVLIRDNYPPEARWLARLKTQEHSVTRQALELVGPKGYEHGWKFIGVPGPGGTITPHDHLGISRGKMPQLTGPDKAGKLQDYRSAFEAHLRAQGVTVTRETVSPRDFRASQNELNKAKVERQAGQIGRGEPDALDAISARRPAMVSADNRILDNHHKWAALVLDGKHPLHVLRIGLPAREALTAANEFARSHGMPARDIATDMGKAVVHRLTPAEITAQHAGLTTLTRGQHQSSGAAFQHALHASALLSGQATAIALAATPDHRHIPGTSYNWRHTWIPLTQQAALSHFRGRIPARWHPSGTITSQAKAAPREKIMNDRARATLDAIAEMRGAAARAQVQKNQYGAPQYVGRGPQESAAALDALAAEAAKDSPSAQVMGKQLQSAYSAWTGTHVSYDPEFTAASRKLQDAVIAQQTASAMSQYGLSPSTRHITVTPAFTQPGHPQSYADIRDPETLGRVAQQAALRGNTLTPAEGPPDVSKLPASLRNLYQTAVQHGWNVGWERTLDSGGEPIEKITATNPDTNEKSEQSFVRGKRFTYGAESVSKSLERIRTNPRRQYAAPPETVTAQAAAPVTAARSDAWIRTGNFEDSKNYETGYKRSDLRQTADFGATINEEHRAGAAWNSGLKQYSWHVDRQRTDREPKPTDRHGQPSNWESYLAQGTEDSMAKAKTAAVAAIRQKRLEHILGGGDVGYGDAPTGQQIRDYYAGAGRHKIPAGMAVTVSRGNIGGVEAEHRVTSHGAGYHLTYGGHTSSTLPQGRSIEQAAAEFKAHVDGIPARQAADEQRQQAALRETTSTQLGRDRRHQALNPLGPSAVSDAWSRAHGGKAPPMADYRRWNASGVTEAEHKSPWYQAELQRQADAGMLSPGDTRPGQLDEKLRGRLAPSIIAQASPPRAAAPASRQSRLVQQQQAADQRFEAANRAYQDALKAAQTPGGGFNPRSPEAQRAESLRQPMLDARAAQTKARLAVTAARQTGTITAQAGPLYDAVRTAPQQPEWQREMERNAQIQRAAGESNARAMNRNMALAQSQRTHLHDATGLDPQILDAGNARGMHPDARAQAHSALMAEDFARVDQILSGEHARLSASGIRPDRQDAAHLEKTRQQIAAAAAKARPALPGLNQLSRTSANTLTAVDHKGREFQLALRGRNLTVTHNGRSMQQAVEDRQAATIAARELAGQLSGDLSLGQVQALRAARAKEEARQARARAALAGG